MYSLIYILHTVLILVCGCSFIVSFDVYVEGSMVSFSFRGAFKLDDNFLYSELKRIGSVVIGTNIFSLEVNELNNSKSSL